MHGEIGRESNVLDHCLDSGTRLIVLPNTSWFGMNLAFKFYLAHTNASKKLRDFSLGQALPTTDVNVLIAAN